MGGRPYSYYSAALDLMYNSLNSHMAPQRRVRPRKTHPQLIADSPDSPPFIPSWLDRLQDRIEGLPIPPGATYLFSVVGLSLLMHLPRWLDGSLPRGSLEVNQLTAAVFPVYFFALIHYLNSTARRALANYRPLLDLNAPDYASYEYTLSRMPRHLGYITILLGGFLGAVSFFSSPEAWGVRPSFSVVSRGSLLLAALATQIIATYWMFQAIRQARTIDRIHRITKRVNVFLHDPIYAFSSLTLRSALGLLLASYFYLFLAFYLGLAAIPSVLDAVTIGFATALALAIFFLPLSRMHGHLAAEKQRLLLDMDERYTHLVERFSREVDKGKFTELDSTARAIATLASQRELLANVSPWPWRPETLRSLLTTVALPVILYLASRLVGRLLGV